MKITKDLIIKDIVRRAKGLGYDDVDKENIYTDLVYNKVAVIILEKDLETLINTSNDYHPKTR